MNHKYISEATRIYDPIATPDMRSQDFHCDLG